MDNARQLRPRFRNLSNNNERTSENKRVNKAKAFGNQDKSSVNYLSSNSKLSQEQVERTIDNLFLVRHYDEVDLVYDGRPSKSKNSDHKSKIGSIGNNYKIYVCRKKPLKMTADSSDSKDYNDVVHNENIKHLIKYNPTLDFINTHERTDIIIVVDADKYDKSYITSVLLIIDEIMKYEPNDINIITTNRIVKLGPLDSLDETFSENNVSYSVFSIFDIYPLIGSPTALYGMAHGFELVSYQKLFNKCDYKLIHNSDPLVKIMNGHDGDLIIGTRVCFETSAYNEITIRKIVSIV